MQGGVVHPLFGKKRLRVTEQQAIVLGWVQPERKSNPVSVSAKRFVVAPVHRAAQADAPASRLWEIVKNIPGAQQEFSGAVPGRRYRLDIAFPAERLCVEVDGWEWHGKYKGDFQRDRERQNLLTRHGWRILRFTAKDIRQNPDGCFTFIKECLRSL